MNSIEISSKNFNINFAIDKIKVLYGKNYLLKRKIVKSIEKSINKVSDSEYFEETGNYNVVKYNGEILHAKDFLFYYIENNFDIVNDLKLGTKSLSLKYLEGKLNEIEYNELFNTIKVMLEDLNAEFMNENAKIELQNSEVNFNVEDFNYKHLIKLIFGIIKEDELIKSNSDLTYEEIIEFQIKMLLEISNNIERTIFICIDNYLTPNLVKLIKENNKSNIYFIILNNEKEFNLNDYLLVNNDCIDCFYKEGLYDYLTNKLNYFIDKNDIDSIIKDYINDSCSPKITELKDRI